MLQQSHEVKVCTQSTPSSFLLTSSLCLGLFVFSFQNWFCLPSMQEGQHSGAAVASGCDSILPTVVSEGCNQTVFMWHFSWHVSFIHAYVHMFVWRTHSFPESGADVCCSKDLSRRSSYHLSCKLVATLVTWLLQVWGFIHANCPVTTMIILFNHQEGWLCSGSQAGELWDGGGEEDVQQTVNHHGQ